MNSLTYIITGGFLAGSRTYIIGCLLILQALGAYAMGDLSLADFINKLPEILGGMGLMTLRAGIKS